jgi:hypothetical protein
MARTTSTGPSPWKSLRPISDSQSSTPRPNRSDCGEGSPPSVSSGARYETLPFTMCSRVMRARSVARASPKSVSFTYPNWLMSTFCGVTSR